MVMVMTTIQDNIMRNCLKAKHRIKLEEERSHSCLRQLERQKLEEIRENRQLLILNRNKEDELRKRENKLRDLEDWLLEMEANFNKIKKKKRKLNC